MTRKKAAATREWPAFEMMDSDGYPTEGLLNLIRNWGDPMNFTGIIELLREVWIYKHFIHGNDVGGIEVSTGGWSGHEDIILALQETTWWRLHWYSSRRGGHYEFRRFGSNAARI